MLLAGSVAAQPAAQCSLVLKGARVWDGGGFTARDLALTGDRFTPTAAPGARVIEAGGFQVIAAMTDAHTHGIEGAADFDELSTAMLKRGIFYALNPNSMPSRSAAIAAREALPETIDVVLAGGGITGPGGHPRPLYERLAGFGIYGKRTPESLAGDAYVEAATPAAARAAVAAVAARGGSVVKLYLLDHAGKSQGLAREVFEAAADEARRRGLRALVHVETAADFRVAVAARVAALLHMPGYYPRAELADADLAITPADAAAARAAGVTVVPTLSPFFGAAASAAELTRGQALQRANLTALRDAGVPLAVGADSYGQSIDVELKLLRATGLFSPAQLIEMATTNGARLAFPSRKLGLAVGDEASLVVLQGDPVTNWFALDAPMLAIKQGRVVHDSYGMLGDWCPATPR